VAVEAVQVKAQARAACELYRCQVGVVQGNAQGQVRNVEGALMEPLELAMELSQWYPTPAQSF